MPLVYGQIAAKAITVADTDEVLYTVPAATDYVVGQVIVTNTSTNNRTFRLAVTSGGGAASAEDYLAYDVTLTPQEVWSLSGITITENDVIRVRSDATSSTAGTGIIFQIYGELKN